MKKERIVKPDGRYLIYYTFAAAELVPPGRKRRRPVRRRQPAAPGKER